jgi:hypothetical protein
MSVKEEQKKRKKHDYIDFQLLLETGSLYLLLTLTRTNNLPNVLVNIALLFKVKLDDDGK